MDRKEALSLLGVREDATLAQIIAIAIIIFPSVLAVIDNFSDYSQHDDRSYAGRYDNDEDR